MSKLRILHITSSLKIGGAESLLFDIVRSLDKNEFENFVIYFHNGPNVKKIEDLGVPIFQVKGLICKYDPIFFWKLFCLIKKIKPNCIHSLLWSANFFSSIIAKLLNIPIFCVLHSGYNLGSNRDNKLRSFLDKITFFCVNKIICVSQNVYDITVTKYPMISGKTIIIKNGIDSNYIVNKGLELCKKRHEFGIKDSDFVIGTVGRLVPVKNHEFLIEITVLLDKKHDNIKLIIVGEGPLENLLYKKVKDLGIVERVFFIKSWQAYGFYPLFDCFVQCSQQEGLSIALLEAMSFGVPCIVTSVKHEVIVSGSNGYLSNMNLFDLVRAIEFIYNNHNLSRKIGLAGQRTIIDLFNLQRMIDSYQKLCKSLCIRS